MFLCDCSDRLISDMAPFTTLEMRKTMVYWRFEEHMTRSPEFLSCWLLRSNSLWSSLTASGLWSGHQPLHSQQEVDLVVSQNGWCRVIYMLAASQSSAISGWATGAAFFLYEIKMYPSLPFLVPFVSGHDSYMNIENCAERNELLQAMWQAEYGDIPAEYFFGWTRVVVDDRTTKKPGVGRSWACLCTQSNLYPGSITPSFLPSLLMFHCSWHLRGLGKQDRFLQFFEWQPSMY